jgi:hypothetical protein
MRGLRSCADAAQPRFSKTRGDEVGAESSGAKMLDWRGGSRGLV